MAKTKKRGRKRKPASEKKVQITFYVPGKHRAEAKLDAATLQHKYSVQV